MLGVTQSAQTKQIPNIVLIFLLLNFRIHRNVLNLLLRTKSMSERLDVVEHSNYRTVKVSGAIGIIVQNNLEVTLFSDDLNCNDYAADPTVKTGQIRPRRIIECKLVMEPAAAKSLHNVLSTTIGDYEKVHGTIKKSDIPIDKSKDGSDAKISTPYT